MAVIIALGNDKDLVFIYRFPAVPEAKRNESGSEAPRLGSIEILEKM